MDFLTPKPTQQYPTHKIDLGKLKVEPPTRKFDAELLKKLDPYKLDVDVFTGKDEDKNGYLGSDEYGAGKAAQAEFARYDTNDDGKLTLDEYMAGKQADRRRPTIDWDQLPEFPPILRPVHAK